MASGEQHPVLRTDGPFQDIEVVANEHMQFVCRVREMPTPLRMIIKHKPNGTNSNDQADLWVFTSFAPEDSEGTGGVGGGGTGAGKDAGRKKYVNPKKIMIESKGIIQAKGDKRGPSQHGDRQRRTGHDHSGNNTSPLDAKARFNELLRSLNTTAFNAGGSVGCSSSTQK